MICLGCGNKNAVHMRMQANDCICDKCAPGFTVNVREYDGNRRINKEYLPELGRVVSQIDKAKIEEEMGVKIINKPIDKASKAEKMDKVKSRPTMNQRNEVRKNKRKELDRRYKRKV